MIGICFCASARTQRCAGDYLHTEAGRVASPLRDYASVAKPPTEAARHFVTKTPSVNSIMPFHEKFTRLAISLAPEPRDFARIAFPHAGTELHAGLLSDN